MPAAKVNAMNGFTLFTKDVKRQLRESGQPMPRDWTELKEIASARWTVLPCEEQRRYKTEAKELKRQSRCDRRRGTADALAGDDDPLAPDVRDECALLEQFHRKRERDVTRLLQNWEWECSDDVERQQQKKFVVVSCQVYSQESGVDGRTMQWPAELAAVEFSLANGVSRTYHKLFPLLEAPSSAEQAAEVAERCASVHAVAAEPAAELRHFYSTDFVDAYNFLYDVFSRRGRVFAFNTEWLHTLGALEYIAQRVASRSLFHQVSSQLVCVEDLLAANVRWFKHEAAIDCERVADLRSLIVEHCDDWRCFLCDYHAAIMLDGPVKHARNMKYVCAQVLAKGAASFLRRWLVEGKVDANVQKALDDTRTLMPAWNADRGRPPSDDGRGRVHERRDLADTRVDVGRWLETGTSQVSANARLLDSVCIDEDDDVIVLSEDDFETEGHDLTPPERFTPALSDMVMAAEESRRRLVDVSPPVDVPSLANHDCPPLDPAPPRRPHDAASSSAAAKVAPSYENDLISFGSAGAVANGVSFDTPTPPNGAELSWFALQECMPVGFRGLGRGLCRFDFAQPLPPRP